MSDTTGLQQVCQRRCHIFPYVPGLILGLRQAIERRCYFVATSLIGWVQA